MSSGGGDFVAYLKEQLPQIEAYLSASTPRAGGISQAALLEDATTQEVADLDRYLYDLVHRFVSSGGKRVRPALCLLGAQAVGAPAACAQPAAAAVELFQAAALIHDDIADQSELRRGVPCLHISEGVGLAINAGDAALVAVSSCILHNDALPADTRLRLLDEILTMEDRTLEGQALDLGWARDNRWDLRVDDYLYMASHKTAYYSAAIPLVLGALCGGGTNEQVEGLRSYGMRCGLAFQIQDDLLNLVGDADAQGKDFRSDVTEGKRTLVMVWALEHLEATKRDELVSILSAHTTDPAALDRAVAIVHEVGALDFARAYAQDLVRQAKTELNQLTIATEARSVLRSMADFFVERRS